MKERIVAGTILIVLLVGVLWGWYYLHFKYGRRKPIRVRPISAHSLPSPQGGHPYTRSIGRVV